MMADSITLVSIITLVDQFHLAARSARMLPMRSSSAPIRQHLQSAIRLKKTVHCSVCSRWRWTRQHIESCIIPDLDAAPVNLIAPYHHQPHTGESPHVNGMPSVIVQWISNAALGLRIPPTLPFPFSLISFSSLGPAHTQADCRLPGNPSETNTATRFRLIVSSRPNLLLHGALSGSGRVRFCKMPAYGEDGDKGHVR